MSLTDKDFIGLDYDPPQGWRYGFPKPYRPLEGETFVETLIRDGYPAADAEWASVHTRFLGEPHVSEP